MFKSSAGAPFEGAVEDVMVGNELGDTAGLIGWVQTSQQWKLVGKSAPNCTILFIPTV
jgi:hypothetical protein